MKKKITTAMLIAAMSMSIMACGGDKTPETQVPTTEAPVVTETVATTEASATTEALETETEEITIDIDKCASELKDNLPLEPDYSFVQDYYIGLEDGGDTIIFSAVVDDSVDPSRVLDFADTLIRQMNLYAQDQEPSLESSTKDFYGGLYKRYDALVGISPASQSNGDVKNWFIYDAITGGRVTLKLNKQYR